MVAAQQLSAEQYAAGVVGGDIPANRYVRLACERFHRDLETADARGLVYDRAAAAHAIAFVECLRHSKNEWRGLPLVLSGWQRFIVAQVFGWRWKVNGFRRFKRVYVEVPRKNGKSTLAAAIALYMLVADNEGAPEVYTAATSKEQAKIVFAECVRMIKASPALRARIACFRTQATIDNRDAVLAPLHSKSENLDGLNLHCGIVDEYHEHRTSETHDKMRTSTGARRQALIFIITTAGDDQESACYRERRESVNVLDSVTTDDALFAYIAGIDPGDDWQDEAAWAKANPNLGCSRFIEQLREEFASARNSPAKEADFKRYYLDVWTNEEKRWLRLEDWDACPSTPVTEADIAGLECHAGLDIASHKDLNALVLYFPAMHAIFARFFMPRANLAERERRDRVPYRQWIEQGWIIATEGNITDTAAIREEARRLAGVARIISIGADPWNLLTLATQLTDDGFTVAEFRQGYASLSSPSKRLEQLVLSHALRHGANPVLRWMAAHVCVETDPAENIKPSKAASTERIDGIVAAVMAIGRAMVEEPAVAVPSLDFI